MRARAIEDDGEGAVVVGGLPDVRPSADVAPATSRAHALAALDAIDRVETFEQADVLLRQITAYQAAVRLARIGREHAHRWATIRLRAERKMGELLGPAKIGGQREGHVTACDVAGAEREAIRRARKLAAVPEDAFTAYLETAEEPTRAGLLRSVEEELRTARAAEKRQRSAALATVEVAPLLDAYPVLCADPPWRYDAISTPDAVRGQLLDRIADFEHDARALLADFEHDVLDAVGAQVARFDPRGEVGIVLDLEGRLNKLQVRDVHRYVLSAGMAAELLAELIVAAQDATARGSALGITGAADFQLEMEAAISQGQARRGLSPRNEEASDV